MHRLFSAITLSAAAGWHRRNGGRDEEERSNRRRLREGTGHSRTGRVARQRSMPPLQRVGDRWICFRRTVLSLCGIRNEVGGPTFWPTGSKARLKTWVRDLRLAPHPQVHACERRLRFSPTVLVASAPEPPRCRGAPNARTEGGGNQPNRNNHDGRPSVAMLDYFSRET